MVFLLLFLAPISILIVAHRIWGGLNWSMIIGQLVIQAILASTSTYVIYHHSVDDTEVWNGFVTDKKRVSTFCSHSYPCNCVTTSGRTSCQTCYEHLNDWDWEVYTTNPGEVVTIDRVDRQGSRTPPRWDQVVMGEPTAVPHKFVNYIKGAPDTLFRHQGLVEKYQGRIPMHPEVFDYYHIHRFIGVGTEQNGGAWNEGLTKLNSDLGALKQSNALVVLTHEEPEWYFALEEAWMGGKKNDIVLVIGVDEANAPVWANVMAWTDKDLFKVKLRDDVVALPKIEPEAVLPLLRSNIMSYYERKPMHDFEYLKASIKPSALQWFLALLISLVTSAITLAVMYRRGFGNSNQYSRVSRYSVY